MSRTVRPRCSALSRHPIKVQTNSQERSRPGPRRRHALPSVPMSSTSTARELFTTLRRPGPHGVLRGQLALVGLPGTVHTPRSGLGLPAVVFGHGWLQPSARYHGVLRHLASWGIVAAAPSTQRGPLPSHRLYAADLRTALDVCTRVRLGDGDVSVDPD